MRVYLIAATTFLLMGFGPSPCKTTPELNNRIVNYVRSMLGRTVGDGECWSLAAAALDKVGARWDHDYAFGRKLDLLHDCIAPGDIIQFENLYMEHQKDNTIITMEAEHHTAIFYQVSPGMQTLAEQNTSAHGRKTGLSEFNFSWIKSGTFTIYRPIK